MTILALDVGTTSVRAAAVDYEGRVVDIERRPCVTSTPAPGRLEFDAARLADDTLDAARTLAARHRAFEAVGIANQRASTVVWDRRTGRPIGPGLGWQDNRTGAMCAQLARDLGITLLPNQTATKAVWLIDAAGVPADSVCIGTLDSWIAWRLTGAHVTDHTNAAMTGLMGGDGRWNEAVLDVLELAVESLPAIVASSGTCGEATGFGPLAGMAGDQQASLIGQGCITPGAAKLTVGTGAMLDVCTGRQQPALAGAGCFPIIAWTDASGMTFGAEALALAAGSCVEWLIDLGVLTSAAESDALAGSVDDTDGVVFVPALSGLGTPYWDLGARGALFGLTRGTTRAQVVRAVLDGIAHRCAELAGAAQRDTGFALDRLRLDGGLAANSTFVELLAQRSGRVIEVSAVAESTALGAAFLAGTAVGFWPSLTDASATWHPARMVVPKGLGRSQDWGRAIARTRSTNP